MTTARIVIFSTASLIINCLPLTLLAQIHFEILKEANNYTLSTDSTQYYYVSVAASNVNNCTVVGRTEHWKRFINEPLILRTTNAGSTWVEQKSGLPSGNTINIATPRSICAIDSLHLFICGDSGMFLRTSDAGETWQNLPISTNSNLLYIYFCDKNNGIVCGRKGTIAITKNAGESWQIYESLSPTSFICAMGYLSALNYRWLAYDGFNGKQFIGYAPIDTQQIIWDSAMVFKDPYNGQSGKFTRSIFFIDSLNGFLVGGDKGPENQGAFSFRAYIARTSNAGQTWEQVYDTNTSTQSELTTICFLSPQLGIAASRFNTLLLTKDGGKSWEQDTINQPFNFQLVQGLAPADINTFYGICQSNGPIFKGRLGDASISLSQRTSQQNAICLFPQPANKTVSIEIDKETPISQVAMYSLLGYEVISIAVNNSKEFELDLTFIPSGVYTLTVTDQFGKTYSKSCVIKK